MMHALEYISASHIANAISVSDGTGEDTYAFGTAQIHANDPGPLAAAAAGIPVTNATGDCGEGGIFSEGAGFSVTRARSATRSTRPRWA